MNLCIAADESAQYIHLMADTASNKPVTIKSIAKELGITFSTVSKALNNNARRKHEMRILVLDTVADNAIVENFLRHNSPSDPRIS